MGYKFRIGTLSSKFAFGTDVCDEFIVFVILDWEASDNKAG